MALDKCIIGCFICDKELENFAESDNHPLNGTEFITHGHYGSSVFDPMDGTSLAINICDKCLKAGIKKGRAITYREQHTRTIRIEIKKAT